MTKRLLLVLAFIASAVAAEDTSWMLLSGYGTTHTTWGGTKQHVETIDIVLRRSVKFKNTGAYWFKGSHNFIMELPVHIVTNPDSSPIFALNFLSSWSLGSLDNIEPYCFVGGGPVYTEADIPGMGSKINGNYQAGLGLYLGRRRAAIECRYHHISNASTANPNDPLNSSKYLVGIKLPF